jgi:glycosyltransferase involved in cell wall biosynthesis
MSEPSQTAPGGGAVTVVIAAFNGAAVIGDQLRALQVEAAGGRVEVVVADNGSTDGTRRVVEGFQSSLPLRLLDASARPGQAFARNRGAAEARADLLLFLDQDDVVSPGYVASMVEALGRDAVVAARMSAVELNPGWIGAVRTLTQTDGLPMEFGMAWAYGSTLGIRRAVFEAVGGFDETLRPAGEDVDLCLRLAAAGHPVTFNPSATVRYRFPATLGGLLRQGRLYGRGHINVCIRHGQRIGFGEIVNWCRVGAAAATWLLPWRSMPRRGQGAFALGRRLGLIEGAARHARQLWRLRSG